MELIIFIIVVGVTFSNLNKQRKASSNRRRAARGRRAGHGAAPHAHGAPDGDAPADAQSVRARQQHSMPAPAPTAQVKPVKAKPFAPSVQKAAKSDDAPRDVDSPHRAHHPRRRTGRRTARHGH